MSTLALVSPDLTQPELNWEDKFEVGEATVGGKPVKAKRPQVAELNLRLSWSLYSWRASAGKNEPVEKYLLVSLQGTAFRPGALMYNQSDRRGYFTESVDVEMSFPSAPRNLIFRQNDSPPTTTAVGSANVSSGISFSLGTGFFGSDLMGNADVGGSISNSFTESLEDFEIVNNSSAHRVSHSYRLAMLRGGVPFRKGSDLVEQDVGGWLRHLFENGAAPGKLYDLPPRATSNLPLVSQALFRAQQPVNRSLDLEVTITMNLLMVEKTFSGVKIDFAQAAKRIPNVRHIPIPFDAVK